jgi:DNA-binding NarL/FixJ family response regulator
MKRRQSLALGATGILVVYDEADKKKRMFQAGAKGYVLRMCPKEVCLAIYGCGLS